MGAPFCILLCALQRSPSVAERMEIMLVQTLTRGSAIFAVEALKRLVGRAAPRRLIEVASGSSGLRRLAAGAKLAN